MYRRVALLLLTTSIGCGQESDHIYFDSSSGAGDGIDDCDCQYYDSSEGDDPSLQVSCAGGVFDDVSFFLDPRIMDQPQGVTLIFGANGGGQFGAGAMGSYHSLGPEKRANPNKIVRTIDGVEVMWSEQDACDVAYGCDLGTYHLGAGAVHAGSGGCKDFWASVAQ